MIHLRRQASRFRFPWWWGIAPWWWGIAAALTLAPQCAFAADSITTGTAGPLYQEVKSFAPPKPTALGLFSAAAPNPGLIGSALWAKGYRGALFVCQPNQAHQRWWNCGPYPFNPNVIYTGSDASHLGRYGVTSSSTVIAGTRVGERIGELNDCMRTALSLPAGYTYTLQDAADMKVVTRGGQQAAWDDLAAQCLSAPVPSPPAPVPPPVLPQVPTPTPTPSLRPCTGAELDGGMPGAIRTPIKAKGGWYYRPGEQSTGKLTVGTVQVDPEGTECRMPGGN